MSSKEAAEFLSEKVSSPFKRLKQCLAAHRIDRPIPSRSPGKPPVNKGFLAIHRAPAYDCLMSSLDAYEQHRDESVEKLKGQCVLADKGVQLRMSHHCALSFPTASHSSFCVCANACGWLLQARACLRWGT